jgi:hypothetical protein
MSQQFSIWVIKLAGRIKALEDKIPDGNVEVLDREANTCKAELQHLYDYAVQQNIELEAVRKGLGRGLKRQNPTWGNMV